MKNLLVLLFITLSNTLLFTQDTLYLKGEKEALLVNITIVKKKSLIYTKSRGGFIRTVKMEDVESIRYRKKDLDQQLEEKNKQDEFRSTISLQYLVGLQSELGLNYMHRLSSPFTQRLACLVKLGGGVRAQNNNGILGLSTINTKGNYLELGLHLEFISKRKPKNRLHVGMNINKHKIKGKIFSGSSFREINANKIVFEIPLGYTFRSNKGFYLDTGLEFRTDILLAPYLAAGWTFGK